MSVAEYPSQIAETQPDTNPDLVRQELVTLFGEPTREVVQKFDDEILVSMVGNMGMLCVTALAEKGFKDKIDQVNIWSGALKGYSYEEQAAQLGLNEFTVRMRRGRMRTFIRKHLPPFSELLADAAGVDPTDPSVRVEDAKAKKPKESPVVPQNRSSEDGWWHYAACKDEDPELFFVTNARDAKDALDICKRCNVRDDCLEEALERGYEHGIWGGKTEYELRALRRKRGSRIS